MGQSGRYQERSGVDGISCVGLLFLGMLAILGLGMLFGQPGESSEPGVQAVDNAHIRPTTTSTATAPPVVAYASFTPVPTVTPLPPTATATGTATTAAATVEPSPTQAPPTATPTATPLPLPTPVGTYSLTVKVPILMYHYISEPPEDADEYRTDLSVSPAAFRAQMQYLADNGFTPIDLYTLSRAITGKESLPPRPVVITFDDGYLDHYQNAFPILQEFGFTGTFFIITGYVDAGNPNHMTWPMIEEMAAAGMRMESHSKTHPDLREATREGLVWEILGSQETLAAHIGYMPRYFCYPGGRYDEDTIAMLEELNFWGAVTTAGGKWHGFNDRFEWTRLRMRYTTSLPVFADMVAPDE